MEKKFKIYLTGFDKDRSEELLPRLARVTRKQPEALSGRLSSLPLLLGVVAAAQDAEKVRHYLEAVGATVRTQAMTQAPPPVTGDTTPQPTEKQSHPAKAVTPKPADSVSHGRPAAMGFWRRLKWTLRIAWRSFWSLAVLNVIYVLVMTGGALILPLFAGVDLGTLAKEGNSLPGIAQFLSGPGLGAVLLAEFIISGLATAWIQAAFLQLPLRFLEKGGRPPIGGLIGGAFHRMPDFLSTTGLFVLIVIAIPTALVLPLVMFYMSASWLLPAVAITVTLAIFVVGAFLGLAPVVAANEPCSPWQALRRGVELARGRRLAIVGNFLLLVILMALVVIAAQMLVGLLSVGLIRIAPIAMFAMIPLGVILVVVAQVVLMAVFHGFLSFFYIEARVIDEAWEPAWAEAPHAGWPLGDGDEFALLANRGWRAWRDLALILLVTLGLIGVGGYFLVDVAKSRLLNSTLFQQGEVVQLGASGSPIPSRATAPTNSIDATGTPAIQLKATTFFGGGEPSFWIKTTVRGIPDFPSGLSSEGLVRILIDNVQSKDGRDLYDRHSVFETKQFTGVSLSSGAGGALDGIRDVHLIAGAKEGDIAMISGRLQLRIPTGIGEMVLDRAGQQKLWKGEGITVEKLSGNNASLILESNGLKQKMLGLKAESDDGKRQIPSMGSSSRRGDAWYYNLQFEKPIRRLHVYLSEDMSASEPSFNLRWEQGISLPISSSQHTANDAGTAVSRKQAYKLYTAGKYQQSIQMLNQIIRSEPENAWAWYTRGWAWWKLNKQARARADMAQACKFKYLDSCNLSTN